MHYQIERVRAIQADHFRAAERYRPARSVPPGPSIWTRLASHLSPPRDQSARATRPAGEHSVAGPAATSTHAL